MANANSKWSIGIYKGNSPFEWTPHPDANNPVLTAEDITDVPADFIADPFMIQVDEKWWMFFEVLNSKINRGEIGVASSINGLKWDYSGIVLRKPWHLSYPYVFEENETIYMIPESGESGSITLYEAVVFPYQWKPISDLVVTDAVDASLVCYQDQWWMFVCNKPKTGDELALYHSKHLLGPWQLHAASPIISNDKTSARPSGRVLVFEDKVTRFAQDCNEVYGKEVRAFVLDECNSMQILEHEHPKSPILQPSGQGWNSKRIHHLDPHLLEDGSWLGCVDGDWKTH